MICLGCSSTGSERINAATSSAVFHFASYRGKVKKNKPCSKTSIGFPVKLVKYRHILFRYHNIKEMARYSINLRYNI